jgi:hypothetical protein
MMSLIPYMVWSRGTVNVFSGSKRQCALSHSLSGVEVPNVPFVRHADGHSFGCVDHAAAAYRENPVHAFLPAEFNSFFYSTKTRIRFHAGQFMHAATCLLQLGHDFVIQAGTLDAAATENQQDCGTKLLCLFLQSGQLTPSKN